MVIRIALLYAFSILSLVCIPRLQSRCYLYFKGEYDPKNDHGFTPGPAHRLDRNTSGLVVFGKNLISLQELEELFKEKDEITKEYKALVVGKLDGERHISAPLLKDEKTGLVRISKLGKMPIQS